MDTATATDLLAGISVDDQAVIDTPPALSATSSMDRLRERHHQLARFIAEGKAPREAAFIVGYAPQTVHGYMADPAFRELVEYYRAQVHVQYLDMHHRLGTLAATAAAVLQDRLEERPASFTNNELRQIVSDACDRSVAPNRGSGATPAVAINVKFVEAPKQQTIELTAEPSP